MAAPLRELDVSTMAARFARLKTYRTTSSDDSTMLVTLNNGHRDWSVPVTVTRRGAELAATRRVNCPAWARDGNAQRPEPKFCAPPADATRKSDAIAKVSACAPR